MKANRHRPPDPFALWRLGAETGRLALEAQTVIGLRLLGMAGFFPLAASETGRMVAEKGAAFARAGAAMGAAAAAGKPVDRVVSAGVKPLGKVTKANVRRLSRRAARTPARKR